MSFNVILGGDERHTHAMALHYCVLTSVVTRTLIACVICTLVHMCRKFNFTCPCLLADMSRAWENLHFISRSLVLAQPLGVTYKGLIQLFFCSQQEENIFMVNGLLK